MATKKTKKKAPAKKAPAKKAATKKKAPAKKPAPKVEPKVVEIEEIQPQPKVQPKLKLKSTSHHKMVLRIGTFLPGREFELDEEQLKDRQVQTCLRCGLFKMVK